MSHAIGILDLQGDVSLHATALRQFNIEPVFVKQPEQLLHIDGLIIPGGESTALLKLAEPIGMLEAITDFAQSGGSIFGTCAGAILLAKTVTHPAQFSLGLIDVTVERNGYGRQIDSRNAVGEAGEQLGAGELPMTFIRAPRITKLGTEVVSLAQYEGEPVCAQYQKILVATFHPELSDDLRVYDYWLGLL